MSKNNRKRYFIFGIALIIIVGTLYMRTKVTGKLSDTIDPDIVLINMEEADRLVLSNLLLTINECKPTLIGIDAWFIGEQNPVKDSSLVNALKIVQNDILAYTIDSIGNPLKSDQKFSSLVSGEGVATTGRINGFLKNVTPLLTMNNEMHEQFALAIIKHWKPSFKSNIKKDQSIPIKFTRALEQFIHINGSELRNGNYCEYLKNKIVLIGYLGPSNEDKYFTPIRFVKNYPENEPDTYGLVIIANQIRTILGYESK
jgi:hypothetical protein